MLLRNSLGKQCSRRHFEPRQYLSILSYISTRRVWMLIFKKIKICVLFQSDYILLMFRSLCQEKLSYIIHILYNTLNAWMYAKWIFRLEGLVYQIYLITFHHKNKSVRHQVTYISYQFSSYLFHCIMSLNILIKIYLLLLYLKWIVLI